MLFSLIVSYVLLFNDISDVSYVHILYYIALLIYQTRYFYLINFQKKQKVTFQLIEKQRNPILLDTFIGLFLFSVIPILLSYINKRFNTELNYGVFVIFILYLFGTFITLVSEMQRRNWKENHKEGLFKDGLFKYANHINYFGETLSFPAFCWLSSGSVVIFIIVFIHQIVDFIFIQIPKQEKYLQNKYLQDFDEIKDRNKLIPWIY